jgi:hypothetical protein
VISTQVWTRASRKTQEVEKEREWGNSGCHITAPGKAVDRSRDGLWSWELMANKCTAYKHGLSKRLADGSKRRVSLRIPTRKSSRTLYTFDEGSRSDGWKQCTYDYKRTAISFVFGLI